MLNVLVTKSIANKVFEIYFRLTFQAASSNLKTNRLRSVGSILTYSRHSRFEIGYKMGNDKPKMGPFLISVPAMWTTVMCSKHCFFWYKVSNGKLARHYCQLVATLQ